MFFRDAFSSFAISSIIFNVWKVFACSAQQALLRTDKARGHCKHTTILSASQSLACAEHDGANLIYWNFNFVFQYFLVSNDSLVFIYYHGSALYRNDLPPWQNNRPHAVKARVQLSYRILFISTRAAMPCENPTQHYKKGSYVRQVVDKNGPLTLCCMIFSSLFEKQPKIDCFRLPIIGSFFYCPLLISNSKSTYTIVTDRQQRVKRSCIYTVSI